jgi:hypothetical protein
MVPAYYSFNPLFASLVFALFWLLCAPAILYALVYIPCYYAPILCYAALCHIILSCRHYPLLLYYVCSLCSYPILCSYVIFPCQLLYYVFHPSMRTYYAAMFMVSLYSIVFRECMLLFGYALVLCCRCYCMFFCCSRVYGLSLVSEPSFSVVELPSFSLILPPG